MYASIITLLVLDYEWLSQSIFLNLKHCASLYYWTFSTLSGRCCKLQQVLEQHWENKSLLEFLNIGSISNENVCVWLRKVPQEEFLLETLLGKCRKKKATITVTDTFLQYLISAQTFTGHQGTYIFDSLISVFCSIQTNDIVDKGAEILTKVGEGERDSQMDLAKVVPGLTSLDMLVPQVQAATVNVVQVSGSSAVANPQPPVPITPGPTSILTPVSVVSGPDVGDSNSSGHDILDNRSLVHQNCGSVAEQVSDTLSKADDSQTIQESSQVSPHIQKVGQPFKTKEHTESEQDEKTVYRLIMKEGRGMEQYYSTEHALDSVISAADSNNAVSYSQDVIKILKKKKERELSILNESSMASLPKFQHAFGRQLYQGIDGGTGVVVSGTGNNDSGSQFGTAISERTTRGESVVVVTASEKEDSTLSKAVQTVLKEAESAKVGIQSTTQQRPQPQPMTKETPEVASQSQGVIFTCKVPISISNNSLLQGKPVAILKGSSDLIVHGQKVSEENKKDSVIRSNMSALLAAALQTAPIKNITNLKKQEKGGEVIVRESTSKVHVPASQVQKAKRPAPVQTSGGTKLVRSENLQTGSSSPSSLVTIPLPARAVVLAMNQARAASSSTSSISNKIDRTDQTNVCSSTLEQLREFESVLEHVTNTSQMKERCVKKPGAAQPSSVTQDVLSVQSHNQQTQVSHQATIVHKTMGQGHNSNNHQQTSTVSTPTSPKETTPAHTSTEFTTPIEITERVVTLVSKGGSTTVQAVQTTGNVQKMSATPVVVVQSCSSRQSSPSPTPSHKLKINKPKAKSSSICKTSPITTTATTTLKVSALSKPQQKPQEDEQTTQRIYAILDKYAEQLRNSPELKNKPAPRRRSNPPTNPAQSSKRKKGSKKSTGCCSVDASPIDGCCEDVRTLGSEDSSTEPPATPAPIRHTDDISLPAHLQAEDVSSETCESSTDSKEVTTQTIQQSPSNSSQHQSAVRQTCQPQESLHAGSVLNVEQATKVLSGKQLVVGTPATVPLTLSLPAAANLKQVIFPVPTDGRPFVVAKVPKMYRVHQVTVPGNSPLIAASTGGAVLLRQMCLNKTTVKQVKVPVQVSGITGTGGVVLPGGSQSFTLDGESLVLDNNTILVNTSGHGTSNNAGVSVTSSGATVSLLQRTTATAATCGSNRTSSSTMTSHHDHVFTQDQALQTHSNLNHSEIKYVNRSGEIVDERGVQKQPWLHILREIKVGDDQGSLERKEDVATSDKGCGTKDNVGKFINLESVIKVKPSLNNEKTDGVWHSMTSTPPSATVLSVKSTPTVGRRLPTPVSSAVTPDSWRKSRDLRLQKSLSEECEDLGVDKPSTSDLFPEAELLLDTDPLSRDSLHEMYSSSSRDSSPTPRYQWKKRGMTSRLLGKRQESDSSCPSTPLNGDPGEEESETGSECDWWPGIGENGRSQHGHGVNTSGSATITPLSQITRKRKIGLYATDSDDTDLDDSSSEKGTSLKSSCPPLKRECQYANGLPARRETIKTITSTGRSSGNELHQHQEENIDHNISQNYIAATQVSHCTTITSTTPIAGKATDIGQKIKNSNTTTQSNIRQQQPINRKR
ncbi:uncharacterized protein isoform X4 [Rhodnius prolixus]|uniref:uncharacterized protein isoform X4 n=1 Tax=Rhodnius prolixus TaxID=13249 RepID=UPI003D18D7F1